MKLSTMTDADLSRLFAQAAIELNNRKRLTAMTKAMLHAANPDWQNFRRAMCAISNIITTHPETAA